MFRITAWVLLSACALAGLIAWSLLGDARPAPGLKTSAGAHGAPVGVSKLVTASVAPEAGLREAVPQPDPGPASPTVVASSDTAEDLLGQTIEQLQDLQRRRMDAFSDQTAAIREARYPVGDYLIFHKDPDGPKPDVFESIQTASGERFLATTINRPYADRSQDILAFYIGKDEFPEWWGAREAVQQVADRIAELRSLGQDGR